MENSVPTRADAYQLLTRYNQSESLIKHALAVEAVMLHFARLLQEPEPEKWGIIGLLHDLDYELYPDQHCIKVREILTAHNWPEEYIHAVQSHGWDLAVDVAPEHQMEKILYAVDELTGLITATAILRPSQSILDLEVKSVKKKWKQKGFAVGVNREVITKGAGLLNLELDYIIRETINGLKNVADEIGLKGNL